MLKAFPGVARWFLLPTVEGAQSYSFCCKLWDYRSPPREYYYFAQLECLQHAGQSGLRSHAHWRKVPLKWPGRRSTASGDGLCCRLWLSSDPLVHRCCGEAPGKTARSLLTAKTLQSRPETLTKQRLHTSCRVKPAHLNTEGLATVFVSRAWNVHRKSSNPCMKATI